MNLRWSESVKILQELYQFENVVLETLERKRERETERYRTNNTNLEC